MIFSINKVLLIAQREFKIRVRKKSFWITTVLGPLIFAVMMIVPLWMTMDSKDEKIIIVTSSTGGIIESLPELSHIKYIPNTSYVSHDSLMSWYGAQAELRYEHPKFLYQTSFSDPVLEKLFEQSVSHYPVNLQYLKPNEFVVNYAKKQDNGRGVKEIMAYGMGLSVYFFIFMYGVQVMKGVVEEKTNRIIEVMLCTVKPFELMLGKIFGVSWVGLVQFVIWLLLVFGIESYLSSIYQFDSFTYQRLSMIQDVANLEVAYEVNAYLHVLAEMNWSVLVLGYLFFFYVGFLLYAALFAVIGSASDVDTDTQQFIFPLTVPLLGTVLFAQKMIGIPDGTLAKTLSTIPFSSPIAMPMRIPFMNELPNIGLELLISAIVLLTTFFVVTWIASRIYRIGILSYGSKVGYKDLIKWFTQSD